MRATMALLLSMVLLAGCGSGGQRPARGPAASQPEDAPITNTDACATRMHELCGPLLLYYAANRKLPDNPEGLLRVPGLSDVKELVCPVSTQPYIYKRAGLLTPGGGGRVILYDATPAHQQHRWAIAIQESADPNQPFVAMVIALPESFFAR